MIFLFAFDGGNGISYNVTGMRKSALIIATALMALGAAGAGFGLYEMDAKSTAFGGNVVGKPFGPSTVYYNPAGMSCLTGTSVYVGCTMLYPPIPFRTWGGGYKETDGRIDPGAFIFPTAFITQQLPWDLTFGLGFYADFGLGSKYDDNWALKYDSVQTDFEGFTLNPALSYKVTDKLSVAGGLRVTYVTFETTQVRDLNLSRYMGAGFPDLGENRMTLSADNARNLGLGFNLGARYQLTDDISLGIMYRSPLRTTLEGDASWRGPVTMAGGRRSNPADETIELPQQVTVGFNWDDFLVKDLHFGMSASYIGWSCIEAISFNVYNPLTQTTDKQTMDMNWRDTVRAGLGFGYDITENWEALLGYVFDKDPSSDSIGNAHTMLPPGDRHVISFGGAWHTADRRWEIAFVYAPIIMQHSCATYRAEYGDAVRYMDTTASCTHCVCVGLQYNF